MYGYTGKLLFVNLTDKTHEVRELSEELAYNFIGGAGLGARILYENMPPHTDPFSEKSMIGFLSGPANCGALFGGRYTVVCKSPVYKGWSQSNAGGTFGPALKKCGFDAIFVNGISDTPVYIFVDNGEVEIRDASKFWGMGTHETEDAIREELDDPKVHVAMIGPAGEKRSLMAAVMNDGHRTAARGGPGAVMGSKRLKALAVRGDFKVEVADKQKLIEINRMIADHLKNGPCKGFAAYWGQFGTNAGIVGKIMSADAGIKNWKGAPGIDFSEEEANAIMSDNYDGKYKVKKYACALCPVGCGAYYKVDGGKWPMEKTKRPEYETASAFGCLCLNSDITSIMKCNDMCNEYGMDTMSVGPTVAWTIECFEEGVLTKDQLDGIEPKWGDADAIVALTEKICKMEGVGEILGNGSRYASEYFGVGKEFLVVASGLEEPQHDARLSHGLARTYQYDPSPGRHTRGSLGMGAASLSPEEKATGEGTGERDARNTSMYDIRNSSGHCSFTGMGWVPKGAEVQQINAITGFDYDEEQAFHLGQRIYLMRHSFNIREGLRREDFTTSKRIISGDPPFNGPHAGIRVQNEKLADGFFKAMGIDPETFLPNKEKLEELGGLDCVINDIYSN